jgi:hypothetical protein
MRGACLYALENKRTFSLPEIEPLFLNIIPQSLSPWSIHYTDSAIQAPNTADKPSLNKFRTKRILALP